MNGLCSCKECNEKVCKWCGDTLHEMGAKEVCQEYIDTIKSDRDSSRALCERLAEALKEIIWIGGVARSREGSREGYARIDGKAKEALAVYDQRKEG